jgi:hypothetical protein
MGCESRHQGAPRKFGLAQAPATLVEASDATPQSDGAPRRLCLLGCSTERFRQPTKAGALDHAAAQHGPAWVIMLYSALG